MAVLEIPAAEGFDQFTVVIGLLNFNSEVMKDLIFLTLLQPFLHIVVLHLIVFDIVNDTICILLQEVAHVPLIFLVLEVVSVGPESVALLIASFKGFNFVNLSSLVDIKHVFILLEFLHLVVVGIELLSNLCELSKSLTRQDFGFGEDFVIESDNLLTNIILLLLDLGAEVGEVAISGHFCFILGSCKIYI